MRTWMAVAAGMNIGTGVMLLIVGNYFLAAMNFVMAWWTLAVRKEFA